MADLGRGDRNPAFSDVSHVKEKDDLNFVLGLRGNHVATERPRPEAPPKREMTDKEFNKEIKARKEGRFQGVLDPITRVLATFEDYRYLLCPLSEARAQ